MAGQKIVFMGTPRFSIPTIEELISSSYHVVAVYTQPDQPSGRGQRLAASAVKRVALEHGLAVNQPQSLRQQAEIDRLGELSPDVIIVAAYGHILPQQVLDIPPYGCLNVHPSLLPRHRGASPIAAAILSGDEETGVSIMLMDAGMDTGPIIAQTRVIIEAHDTTESLEDRLSRAGADLLMQTLPLWFEGQLTPQPQDDSKATYSKVVHKQDGEIDWRLPAVELWRQVRAFHPWPGSYTRWRGRMLKVLEAAAIPRGGELVPGRVIELEVGLSMPLGVETGDGVLALARVQLEGRKAMAAADFLRGAQGLVGEVLGSKALS